MIDLTGACRRHRAALVAFVDRGEVGAGTSPALAHLDRCGRCLSDLEATTLTVTALRRIGDELEAVEPSSDAWPRLRSRIERAEHRRPPVMSPIAGVAMSLVIVAAFVGLSPGMQSAVAPDSAREARVLIDLARAEEEAWLRERVRFGRRPAPEPASPPADVSAARLGPDGIEQVSDRRPSSGRWMVWA